MTRFIAGYPCTRKTTFGDWLRDHRGFLHIDLEGARFARSSLKKVWDQSLKSQDIAGFIREMELLHPRVVITWGFPHQCAWTAALFLQSGARLSWFDADAEASRAAWIHREGKETHGLDHQLSALREHREDFVRSFSGSIIPVLSRSGDYMEFLQIADIIGIPGKEE